MTVSADGLNTFLGMVFLVYAFTLTLVLLMRLVARAAERRFLAQRAAAAAGLGSEGAAAATSSIGGDLRVESAAERARPERGPSASTFAAEDREPRGRDATGT